MAAARSRTQPTTSSDIVSAEVPIIWFIPSIEIGIYLKPLTARLTGVEPDKKANNPRNNQTKTKKIKFRGMCTEGSSLVRVEVEEEEQNRGSNTTGRQVYPKTPGKPMLEHKIKWLRKSQPSPADVIGKNLHSKSDHKESSWKATKRTPPSRGPMTLAIPQVAPINPPYLPRLHNNKLNDWTTFTWKNALLQRHNVWNCDLDELYDASSAYALDCTTYDKPCHILSSTT